MSSCADGAWLAETSASDRSSLTACSGLTLPGPGMGAFRVSVHVAMATAAAMTRATRATRERTISVPLQPLPLARGVPVRCAHQYNTIDAITVQCLGQSRGRRPRL